MKRRDFLNSSLLAAAASLPGIRAAYAVRPPARCPTSRRSPAMAAKITLRGAEIRELAAQMRGRCCSPATRAMTRRG